MYKSTIEWSVNFFSSYNLEHVTSNGITSTKEYRIQTLQDDTTTLSYSVPSSYSCSTEREDTCYQSLDSKLMDWKSKWTTRKFPWFIVAHNEFHIPKCICAAIQPTSFPLYCDNAETCAKHLALHMEYEPLFISGEIMDSPPKTDDDDENIPHDSNKIVVSPTQTLEWGMGDCFDLSTLLVSFLLGMGYDAYVVHGSAPKWIRTLDESKVDRFSFYRESDDPIHQSHAAQEFTQWMDSTWKMKSSIHGDDNETYSHPLRCLLLEQDLHGYCNTDPIQVDFEESHSSKKDSKSNNGNNEEEEEYGEHCWVYVRHDTRSHKSFVYNNQDGKSLMLSQCYFIEPSTGQRFELDHGCCPYKDIYAMWNAKNYWIHLPAAESNHSMSHSIMEFPEVEALWKPIFTPTNTAKDEVSSSSLHSNKVQPPMSWVRNLPFIAEKKLSRGHPTYPPKGQRTFNSSNGKVELFAKGVNPQGLEKRVTKYMNASQHCVQEICEYFWPEGRSDNMHWRMRLPNHLALREKYFANNPIGLEDWYEIMGHRRMIRFRPYSRLDGLLERDETFGVIICDTFQYRVDGIAKREIHFKDDGFNQRAEEESMEFTSTDSGPLSRAVKKIILRYSWDNHQHIKLQTEEKMIATRTFLLDEKRVITEYFNENGSIHRQAASVSYTISRRSILQNYNSDERNVNKDLSAQVNSILTSIRSLHYEMQEILKSRERT